MKVQNNEKELKRKKVPEKKKKALEELANLIFNNNTIMIISIANVRSFHFQKFKRMLKNKAIVKVVKKNLALKALERSKEKKVGIEKLGPYIKSNFALLFSNLDPFEIASILAETKTPSRVKAGQIAPKDIVIEAGPTDFPAGPIISEFSKIKVKAGIEGGKITIKEASTVVKSGEVVSEDVASVLAKLEIMPLSIGLEPIAAYDSKEKKIYSEIKIDKEALLKELKENASLAFAFAIYICYPSNETIKTLIAKSNAQANAISELIK
ncbi:MAG: 50S ribosomal protein L10 [Candidatus Pacearchaeota archaeon]|nr:50S ribosomal protein L10 [Candidatus Pacearchaeota archaeon]